MIRLAHHALARATDGHDGEALLFGQGKGASIQHIAQPQVFFLQDARAGAGGGGHFREFDSEPGVDLHDGLIEFGACPFGHAAWKKGVFHGVVLTRLNNR